MTVIEHVDMGAPASFVWDYDARRPRLNKLYEKSKTSQWNATTDIDWSIDIDPGHISEELLARFAAADFDFESTAVGAFAAASDENRWLVEAQSHAWTVSQFMHGEQGALVATAKICAGVESIDDKYYAAAQVADEARHVEVYRRYLTEKLPFAFPVNPHLHTLLAQIIREPRWDMTYLGMQIMVEGLALAAFGLMNFMNPQEPLIQQITGYVIRDEARHVAFGVLSLEEVYRQMTAAELREREEFVIEAAHLMRDRLLMEEVWERLGYDVDVWVKWSLETPFMQAFRQLLFAKIVPNLKRLGLLTPRVREAFAKIGVLQFEDMPDSTQDERVTVPPALAALFPELAATAPAL